MNRLSLNFLHVSKTNYNNYNDKVLNTTVIRITLTKLIILVNKNIFTIDMKFLNQWYWYAASDSFLHLFIIYCSNLTQNKFNMYANNKFTDQVMWLCRKMFFVNKQAKIVQKKDKE